MVILLLLLPSAIEQPATEKLTIVRNSLAQIDFSCSRGEFKVKKCKIQFKQNPTPPPRHCYCSVDDEKKKTSSGGERGLLLVVILINSEYCQNLENN